MSLSAIISDIHGNLTALQAVLADIDKQNVDEIVCIGDICGYGPQPAECVKLVRERAEWCLKGNHDEALFTDPLDFGPNALESIRWQRRVMTPTAASCDEAIECWNWLLNLPAERREGSVHFVHASPRDPLYEYVLREDFDMAGQGPSRKGVEILAATEWLCFCGHSHRPGIVWEDYQWHLPSELEGGAAVIKNGFKALVNIGSVGQPRDGIPSACYVLFDYQAPARTTKLPRDRTAMLANTLIQPRPKGDAATTGLTAAMTQAKVTFRRVAYDVAAAQARFFAVPELPRNNALRLAKGV